MTEIVQLCMLSNNYYDMLRKMSFDRVYCLRAMIACETEHRPTVCVKRL